MPDITWSLPTPSSGGYWPVNPSRSGGVSFAGTEQVVVSMGQRWYCEWNVSIRNTAQMLEARSFFARASGKAGNILVPDFQARKGVNWPVDAYGRTLTPRMTHRSELDGTIYADPEIPTASQVIATVNTSAAMRATTLSVHLTQGAPLRRGQRFSLGGNRLYTILTFTGPFAGIYSLSIMPPLRAAATAGAAVDFMRPICLMHQDGDDQGLQKLDMMAIADLTLKFVEALP